MTPTLQPSKKYHRIIQLELNEISIEIIKKLIIKEQLPNFAKVCSSWHHCITTSEQTYEHLEPWIQWITAHTGKTFAEHQIFHLSDAEKLQYPQIWESLSHHGVESAIIGSMNSRKGDAKDGIFFPDPWTKDGAAYPKYLQPLWDLISRKVQGHATQGLSIADIMSGLKTCLKFRLPINLYKKIFIQLLSQTLNSQKKWRLAAIFDLFLAEIFFSILKNTNFGFYTLFLNSVAHYQHHHWRRFDPDLFNKDVQCPDSQISDDPILYGYKLYDHILGKLINLAHHSNTLIIIASGLSQKPFIEKEHEGGMNYYRLRNHQQFLHKLGLDFVKAYSLMSRDWQVVCDDPLKLQTALKTLQELKVNGESLFKITINTVDSFHVETAITKQILKETMIQHVNGESFDNFNNNFSNIAVKSGHHTGEGCLWFSEMKKETQVIPLTELFHFSQRALGLI